jgi:hypothetical protein
MGNTYVISGLRDKRARLAGEIAAAEVRLAAKRETLANLDAVIRLFSPQTDPELIAAVRPCSKHGLFFRRGEATRLCFDVLREAGKPVPTHQVTARVVAAKGFDDVEGKVKAAIVVQIRQALVRTERRGQVRKVLVGPECWWELVEHL